MNIPSVRIYRSIKRVTQSLSGPDDLESWNILIPYIESLWNKGIQISTRMGEDQSNRHYVRIAWVTEYAHNFISSKASQKLL